MRFLSSVWLWGALAAVALAAALLAAAWNRHRAERRFADAERFATLVTFDAGRRRAWKGVLLVLAVAFAFLAMARPQTSQGQRLVPATNLDVVVVLDVSKSMFARDIPPSRIAQAKAEVGRLVRELAGARFGAVAFAGEPLGFPLTSDGAAVAQFLRQTDPNDMPIGGTAIARALERGREILHRDPKAKDHRKVMLLITDGEDLEGDPVTVAKAAGEEGVAVHVVQVGGRTPERIPDVGPDGRILGWRTDERGAPLTTSLSVEGENQLQQIAQISGGMLVHSDKSATGIETVTRALKTLMTQELAERVETVYEDRYAWPLTAALLLLLAETFLNEAPVRRPPAPSPAPPRLVLRRPKRTKEATS